MKVSKSMGDQTAYDLFNESVSELFGKKVFIDSRDDSKYIFSNFDENLIPGQPFAFKDVGKSMTGRCFSLDQLRFLSEV